MTATNNLLKQLIELNEYRTLGFEKASVKIDDENLDLREVFQEFAMQSRRFNVELTEIVDSSAGEPERGISTAEVLSRIWIDVRPLFDSSDIAIILSEAERSEDVVKEAYHIVVQEGGLMGEALEKVTLQSRMINNAYNTIKALRDMAKR